MLVAITGASGFIGSYTARALKRQGHKVRALVRSTSRRDHIAPSVDEWRVGELSDPQALAGLVAGVEAVIHNGVDWSALDRGPMPAFQANMLGSLNLLEMARQAGCGQFIFVSSVAALHQILPGGRIDENHPTWPHGIYGACKAGLEPFLKAYHFTYGMNTSAWRPAAVYGVDPDLPRSQWYETIRTVKGGGSVSSDHGGKITHVQDVADALAYAVGDAHVAGEFFNLAERYLHWQTVAEIARELSGSSSVIEDRKGPGPKNQFITDKACAFFDRHGNRTAFRRDVEGVRQYVADLLKLI
jgi:nucleoside-diphosphate-sugar epimerase